MMFKTLRSRMIGSYLLVVIICLILASIVFVFFLGRYSRNREKGHLNRQVTAVSADIRRVYELVGTGAATPQAVPQAPAPRTLRQPAAPAGNGDKLVQSILASESRVLNAKLALIAPDGAVVAESAQRPVLGNRVVNLPQGLLDPNSPRLAQRTFRTLGRDYYVASAPTLTAPGTLGYLLAIKPVEQVRAAYASLLWYLAIAGGIALVISMALAFYLSGAITRPVRAVAQAARKMAAGDYYQEVQAAGPVETTELAGEFNVMAERVRTASELQRAFVGNVSHELRTPLTSIEGFSQALLDGVSGSEEEQRHSLEVINEESKRMVRVLRDLLLLSQIDAGESPPARQSVDLTDLSRKLESMYRARAQQDGLTFTVQQPPAGLTVYTDPDRLERILTNLLDNTFKYSGAGGTVSVSTTAVAEAVHISVADTGPGIEPEMLPRIFERFYRVEGSRSKKTGGVGLGLSICKELVESLGGRIWVRSTPGEGSTFTVTLPL